MPSRPQRAQLQLLTGLGCIVLLAVTLAVGCYVGKGSGQPPQIRAVSTVPAPKPVQGKWFYIVVHHSASERGNADIFDREHKARGWIELGYDFVIGNGKGSGDGQIEIGPRWNEQSNGAHCKGKTGYFNKYGIGVCLVGNFEEKAPTPAQLASLRALLKKLCQDYSIPASRVLGHKEAAAMDGAPGSTLCPGRLLDMNAVRQMAK